MRRRAPVSKRRGWKQARAEQLFHRDHRDASKPPLGGHELFFLIGADAFAEIGTWHRWREVVASVEFIVVSRPGRVYKVPEGARVHRLEGVDLPVSSSGIRRKLAEGDEQVDVPPAVLAYIREHGLYR